MRFFQSYLLESHAGFENLSEEDQLKLKEDMLVEVNRWYTYLRSVLSSFTHILPSICKFIDDYVTFSWVCWFWNEAHIIKKKKKEWGYPSWVSYCTTIMDIVKRHLGQVHQWFTFPETSQTFFHLYFVNSMLSHLGSLWPLISFGDCGPWSRPKYQLLSLGTWWVIARKPSSLCVCSWLIAHVELFLCTQCSS